MTDSPKTIEQLYDELREWILVTGVIHEGSSYEYEMRSFIDDAFAAGKSTRPSTDMLVEASKAALDYLAFLYNKQEIDGQIGGGVISDLHQALAAHSAGEVGVKVKDDDLSDYHTPDESGYSRADEEWFFDADGKP